VTPVSTRRYQLLTNVQCATNRTSAGVSAFSRARGPTISSASGLTVCVVLPDICFSFPPFKNDTHPGLDPVIGANGTNHPRPMDGLNVTDPTQEFHLKPFVESLGGEYFFSPSISALSDPIAKAHSRTWSFFDLVTVLTA
jgi:hypothetical protein